MQKFREQGMKAVFLIAALFSIFCVIIICVFLFANGVPAIAEIGVGNFLGGMRWKPEQGLFGIFPMIVGSLYATGLALLIGAPIGILTAIFLNFYCPARLYKAIKPLVNLLAGIPSIVYGFFGMIVLVPFVHNTFGGNGKALITAGILLGFMILPTIIAVSESSIGAVNPTFFEGALGLGASKERAIFKTVLPAAKAGVSAAVILGLGRAVGETMAVIMIAGNQAVLPASLTAGFRTLTANIVLEMGYAADLHREALIGTAVVLFVFILIVNALFSFLKRRGSYVE